MAKCDPKIYTLRVYCVKDKNHKTYGLQPLDIYTSGQYLHEVPRVRQVTHYLLIYF